MIEVPNELVRAAFCVVDDTDAAAAEAGDLLQAGVEPDAELGEILNGFERPKGITLFKTVGIASQDVAAAARALANA
jgi:ornithine cyclodeaminase